MNHTSIIITAYNQQDEAKVCVEQIMQYYPGAHIIFVDNGSEDNTHLWLESQGLDYIYFDEGMMPYGFVINTVLENFDVNEKIIVLNPRYLVTCKTFWAMVEALECVEAPGVVGVRTNKQLFKQHIDIPEWGKLCEIEEALGERMPNHTVIAAGGFCYAFNKSLVGEVGKFDPVLCTLENTLLDYQLRAIKEKRINMICQNALVFDTFEAEKAQSNYIALHYHDRMYLKQKWNMNYFNTLTDDKFNHFISHGVSDCFTVLEVGCDMGANLLEIKNAFPNCTLYGFELNQAAVNIGKNLFHMEYGNIETDELPFDTKFDYIIFGDVLEHLRDPLAVLQKCYSLLTPVGRILANIPNLMHISVMQQLLRGEFCYTDTGLLDRTHIHFFTLNEIAKMFDQANYEITETLAISVPMTEEQKELKEKLLSISTDVPAVMYEAYQYRLAAKKRQA